MSNVFHRMAGKLHKGQTKVVLLLLLTHTLSDKISIQVWPSDGRLLDGFTLTVCRRAQCGEDAQVVGEELVATPTSAR